MCFGIWFYIKGCPLRDEIRTSVYRVAINRGFDFENVAKIFLGYHSSGVPAVNRTPFFTAAR